MTVHDFENLVIELNKPFRIISTIGEGAMGIVLHCYDTKLERDVAIKILKKEFSKNEKLIQRFKLEAINIAKLSNHQNIVQVFNIEEVDSLFYIVMEYVDGYKLSDLIYSKKLDWIKSLEIIKICADTLQYTHEHDVIHRDIKSQNIMITKNNIIKLVDFGLSRYVKSDSKLSRTNDLIGTPLMLAPELWKKSSNLTPKSDVYSLGIVLYECVTNGTFPFDAETEIELYKKVQIGSYRSASYYNEELPKEVDVLIKNMLKADPKIRYSMLEVSENINLILNKYNKNEINKSTHNLDILNLDENKSEKINSKSFIAKFKTLIVNNKLSGSKIDSEVLNYINKKETVIRSVTIILLIILSIIAIFLFDKI